MNITSPFLHFANASNDTTVHLRQKDLFKAYEVIRFYIYGVATPLITFSGILGSLASFIIFNQRVMRSSINIYLAGLSFFDFLLLLAVSMQYPPIAYCTYGRIMPFCRILPYNILIWYPIMHIARLASVWTCVAIAFDRFLAVRYPLKIRLWCTKTRARYILGGISLFSVLFCLPTMLEFCVIKNQIALTELRKNPQFILVYKQILQRLFSLAFPWVLMIAFNACMLHFIYKAKRYRDEMSSNPHSRKTTVILSKSSSTLKNAHKIAKGKMSTEVRDFSKERKCAYIATLVVVTFLLFNLPSALHELLPEEGKDWSEQFITLNKAMGYMGNLLVCINSSTNILIYCVMARHFRFMFCHLFGFRCCQNPELVDPMSRDVSRMIRTRSHADTNRSRSQISNGRGSRRNDFNFIRGSKSSLASNDLCPNALLNSGSDNYPECLRGPTEV